jgi:hypothetical protein
MPRELLPSDHRPASATYGANATHGIHATYARGCRCSTADGLFHAPQTTGCREAWREYRRDKERERSKRKKIEAAKQLLREEGLL